MSELLKIADIKIGEGRRPIDEGKVVDLMKSIGDVGLLHNIVVSADMVLVAGAHRIEAFKRMGRDEIPGKILTADGLLLRLAEIDENIVRNALHQVDLATQLAEREEIYLVLHPDTAHNAAFKGNQHMSSAEPGSSEQKTPTFAEDTGAKMGVDPRTIRQHVQIGRNLTEESKRAARENDFRKKELVALARMNEDEQRDAVKKRVSGETDDIRKLAKPTRPKPPTMDEIISSIKDPEIAENKAQGADSLALEFLTNIEAFLASIERYLNGPSSIKAMSSHMSERSKRKITTAIGKMETVVKSTKTIFKEM